MNTTTNPLAASLPTTTGPLLSVGLRVQNLARSVDYYTQLGFAVLREEKAANGNDIVILGAGEREILHLRHLPGGRPRSRQSAGLYHFALLVPDERELGSFLKQSLDKHIPIDGASDHLVSQALYLSDPEGNGIEVYADRPRDQWQYDANGQLLMATERLNAPVLLQQATSFARFSPGLRLGHMHLSVGDVERSISFYQKLGMDLTVNLGGQAGFLSWDGYHHHLGVNIWAGRNVPPVASDAYGLDFFALRRSDLAPATMQDPDGVTVIIRS
jgi:catechol 2,3-dioxygenase